MGSRPNALAAGDLPGVRSECPPVRGRHAMNAEMAPPDLDPADLFVNVRDYCSAVPDHVNWAAEPFAFFGGVSMLAGIWKGGKSTLMAQFMRARETGEPFLGHPVPVGPTILLTEEGGIPVKRKVGSLSSLTVVDRRAWAAYLPDGSATFDNVMVAVRWWCEQQDSPTAVIVDTLAVWGDIEDENDASEMTACIRKLSLLAQQAGACVIVVHHSRKDGGAHGRAIRGSGAIPATVDVYAVLDYAASDPTSRTLTIEGRLAESMSEMTLSYDPGTGYTPNVLDLHGELEGWLAGIPPTGDGYREAELANLWRVSRTSARRRVEKLLNLGRLREVFAKHPGDHQRSKRYWAIAPVMPLTRTRKEDDDQP